MRVVVDKHIPYIKGVLEPHSEVTYIEGRTITPKDLEGVDALIIRTRTQCNKKLLEGSNVRFIGSATIGTDHIDKHYCKKHHITWCNAQGCNSTAVLQYVQTAIKILQERQHLPPSSELIMGVVGVGQIGGLVQQFYTEKGIKCLSYDPFKSTGNTNAVPLEELCNTAHVITFHTPLTKEGQHPTYHMVNNEFVNHLKQSPYLINTARGEVMDTEAIKKGLAEETIGGVVIDCWENEPDIDHELLAHAVIGTPHIAGYSLQGKYMASEMVLTQLAACFKIPLIEMNAPRPPFSPLSYYNILQDDKLLRERTHDFEAFRNHYEYR